MLECSSIEVVYSKVIRVLKGVSLKVPDGTIVSLMGGNGAGKSTTLKAISGLLEAEAGEVVSGCIEWDGEKIENNNSETTSRMGIIQVVEGRTIFQHLTAEENLLIGANMRSDMIRIREDLSMVYEYFPQLSRLRKRVSGYLSGGEQQMLVLGRAMMARPKLMLLDEPSLGLAPLVVEEIFKNIKRVNQDLKTSMLLVEQNARIALTVAGYGHVLEDGRVVLGDTSERLRQNEDIKNFYMGIGELGRRKSYRDARCHRKEKRWCGQLA